MKEECWAHLNHAGNKPADNNQILPTSGSTRAALSQTGALQNLELVMAHASNFRDGEAKTEGI